MDTPKISHTVETFKEARNCKIDKEVAQIKPPRCSNLSKGVQKALRDLQERHDIVIVNADKG